MSHYSLAYYISPLFSPMHRLRGVYRIKPVQIVVWLPFYRPCMLAGDQAHSERCKRDDGHILACTITSVQVPSTIVTAYQF